MTGDPEQAPLLSVRGLSKTFVSRTGWRTHRVQALTDVAFDVNRGEVVALVGESGSGKSTAARIVARLVAPTAGQIWFQGRDVLAEERRPSMGYRARVQMIFQDPFASLNPVHTVRYHLDRALVRHGKTNTAQDRNTKVEELLAAVGLLPTGEIAGKFPHQLSGGQRQRVAIARALAVGPELILADEPTSMLDASIRIDILNLLRSLQKGRGIGCLYITHDLGSARYLADRAVVMYGGYVVETAACDELLDHPAHPYTQRLEAAALRATPPMVTSETTRATEATKGCPFAARCPSVMERCRHELPKLVLRSLDGHSPAGTKVASRRLVRCHLYDG